MLVKNTQSAVLGSLIGSAIGVALIAATASGNAPRTVDVVAFGGQIPPGGDGTAITSLNAPFTNSLGQPGFTGVLASGERFVWVNDQIVWLNQDGLPDYLLTGTEATMGISDDGGWIYSPSTDGTDSVFTHEGLLYRGTDPAPGIDDRFLTFNSRPRMAPDGTAWWIAGLTDTPGGSTNGRALYVCTDPSSPSTSTTPLVVSGEMIDEFTIGNTGIGFGYDISEDSSNWIAELTMAGVPTSSNAFVGVNKELKLRQGDPVDDDDPTTWASFRSPSVNNNGDWVIAGNTNGGPTAEREFLAVNGKILIRRGDTIDGVELLGNWAIRWASINNLGNVAYIWEGGSGASVSGAMFVGHISDLPGSSSAIAVIGEDFDSSGDGIADVTLIDFKASAVISPGIDFSDHPWIFTEVTLRNIATLETFDAIVRFSIPSDGPCADLDGSGTVDGADLGILLEAWGSAGGPADLNGDGIVDGADLGILLEAWGTSGC